MLSAAPADPGAATAIARIDMPSLPWRYLIWAGLPIFKERKWPSFLRAPTSIQFPLTVILPGDEVSPRRTS
jgi:hypothetical protein